MKYQVRISVVTKVMKPFLNQYSFLWKREDLNSQIVRLSKLREAILSESQMSTISQSIRYLKAIDPLNARIIQECCRLGPNNLSSIARSLKIPIETVRYRFRKLRNIGVFTFDVFVRYSKLGLIRCSLFVTPYVGAESQLQATLSAVEYWTYMARCFGNYEGYYAVYALPYPNKSDFEDYLHEAEKRGIAKNFQIVFTGDPHTITPNFRWFDFKKHFWTFPWEDWVEEAGMSAADHSHPALEDPQEYNSHVDLTDVKILSLLEANAARGLREIGKHLGFTASGVKYHWDNHILTQGVVEGYRTVTTGYPLGFSDIFTFHFHCKDRARLARLVNFLSDKVFVVSFAKVLRENSLLAHIRIPKTEFERMMTFLYGIRQSDLINDFSYVKLDLSGYSAESIRPANFQRGFWLYDLTSHLRKLSVITRGKARVPKTRHGTNYAVPSFFK